MEDSQLLAVLRNLFASKEEKPQEISPTDLALIARLLLQRADEKSVYPSLATLSLELNCSEWAITESFKRLARLGWVTVETGARRHRTNRYFVVLEKLPVRVELQSAAVSEDAKSLAKTFLGYQRQWQPKRIFRKGCEQRYAYRFQTLLKKCSGSKWLMIEILNFALAHPRFKAHALAGPHKLRKVWRSLEAAYREAEKTKKEQAA
jgi:hypothetical protein